jgi:signal transduction histidine kinase
MIKFKDLKFGIKQGLSFSVIIFLLYGVSGISYYSLSSLNKEIEEISNNWLERAVTISDLNLNVSQLRVFQLEHAYTFNIVLMKQQEAQMVDLVDQINGNIDKYEKLKKKYIKKDIYSNNEEKLYDEFIESWEEYVDLSFRIFKLSRENKKEEAVKLLMGQAKDVYNVSSDDLVSLVSLSKLDAFKATKRAEKTFESTKNFVRVIVFFAVSSAMFFTFLLIRLITIPIKQLDNAAASVIKGNLNIWLDINSKDEIGRLAKTFLQMAQSLKEYKYRTEEQATKLLNQQKELQLANNELTIKSLSLEEQKTEIEKKNSELTEALNNLKITQNQLIQSEKLASLGQLTAGIAHEINNPINFVLSNVSPLRRDIYDLLELLKKYEDVIRLNEYNNYNDVIYSFKKEIDYDYLINEIENLLDGMDEGAKRTADIVKGLRNFSRMDEGVKKLSDINAGIQSTLVMLKNEIKNRIEVELVLGDIPKLLCYSGKINQALLNLLSNAKDAISGKGKIRVETKCDSDNVYISIKDNGVGMSEEVKNKIFEPFFTTKDVGKGTGLGLSITYGIIEDHKGKIEVKSEEGEGTEFFITLPILTE